MAETFTGKLKLTKRDTGDLNWGAGNNANLDLLDAHAQQGTLRPPRTLLATLGSGAVGSELAGNVIYFYKVTAINAAGETTENQIPVALEAQVSEPASPLPIILQWESVPGASGYRLYKSTAQGQERLLTEVSGESTVQYTDTGATAINGSIPVPGINDAYTAVRKLIAGNNIILTPSHGSGDVTIESTGGGGGGSGEGYPTVTAAPPTGVAATDKANLQSALDAAPPSGGTVQLRDGTYVIDGKLTIQSNTHLRGRGKTATTIQNQTDALLFDANVSDIVIQDVSIDMENKQGSSSIIDDSMGGVTNVVFQSVRFLGEVALDRNSVGWTGVQFHLCHFDTFGQVLELGDANARRWRFESCDIEASQIYVNGEEFQFINNRMTADSDGIDFLITTINNSILNGNILVHTSTQGDRIAMFSGSRVLFTNNHLRDDAGAAIAVNVSGSDCIVSFNDAPNEIHLGPGTSGCVAVGNRGAVDDSGSNNVVSDGNGGGPSGYATVVVPAPTGNAGQDRSNIQAALSALSNGGTVILREGTYNITTPVTVLPNTTLIGQGNRTTELSNTTNGRIFNGNVARVTLRDIGFVTPNPLDNTLINGGVGIISAWRFENLRFQNELVFDVNGNGWFDLHFVNCLFENNTQMTLGGGAASKNWRFDGCFFSEDHITVNGDEFSFQHCRFYQQSGAGFSMIDWEGARGRIQGCFFEAALSGLDILHLITTANTVMAGNIVRRLAGSGGASILLDSGVSNCLLIGNDAPDGISLDAAATGNVIVANRGTVALNGAVGNVVADDFVSGVRRSGEASYLRGEVELEEGTGITLTQDGPNKKITIAASGGGGAAGYATQVVGAPTGVAATDTSNIQTALSAAGTAGGGIVQLREGSYLINATLTIPAKVTLQGMGRDATTILCDAAMGAVNTIATSGNSQGLRDLKVDENQPGRSGGSPFVGISMSGTNALIENCQFVRNKSSGSWIFLSTGGQMRNCIILNNGNGLSNSMVQGGDLIESCVLTLSQNNGSVNDFMQSPTQVVNCRLIRSFGSMSGAGIRASSSNKVIVGNTIAVGAGNNAVILGSGSAASTVVGNICNGATILLESTAGTHVVVGNASVAITNNSGNATNQIANNT